MLNKSIATAGCLLAATFAHADGHATKVVFGTNWLAQAEHGGFYQSVADGTYAECGLDVEIVSGGPQVNNRALMLAGRIDEAQRALERENRPAAGTKGPSGKEDFQKSSARLVSLQRASDGLFSEAIWALQRGLSDDPDSAGLKEVLGEIYSERLSDAERRGAT